MRQKTSPRFFCATARTPGSGYGPQRERAFAILSADIAQTFPNERAPPCHGNQTRCRPALDSTGGFTRARARRLGDEYRAAGPASAGLFDRLQKSLTDEPDRPAPAETAREFGMTEGAVRQASYRLRQRYRQLLHEEIAHTVMVPGDIEDELRHLIAVLRA